MFSFAHAAGAVAAIVLAFATPAAAVVLKEGVLTANEYGQVYGGDWFGWVGSGRYVFTSDAEIAEFWDFSATPALSYHGHAADGMFWGTGRFSHTTWAALGVPEPVFTLTPTGFIWDMQVPESRFEYYPDSCYYGEFGGCDYDEHYDYAIDLWMIMRFTPESAGMTYKIEAFGLPTPSAAPEPGVWALLIIGFGLAGSAIRSGRRTTLGLGLAG